MTETEKHIAELERQATLGLGLDHETSDAAIAAPRAVKKIRELLRVTDKLGDMIHPAELSELLP